MQKMINRAINKQRKANNKLLKNAKRQKKDEFYTQLKDIERELQYYKSHFMNKVVYCNCDDPNISNFFKYFVSHFKELGLRKVIASCYKYSAADLFHTEEHCHGFYVEYTGSELEEGNSLAKQLTYFKGDGDFRSSESINLLKQSDIVVTNPPFSLFREYVAQLIRYDKKFLIIGNINAITYKEIFTLIKHNQAWLGVNLGRGISGFIVPDNYELYGTEVSIDEQGNKIISPNNCLWLTNLNNYVRNEHIELTKHYNGHEQDYPNYDNYDGINVNRTQDIPIDYQGDMGVPITFLHKFNPKQFEIVRFRKGNDDKDLAVNGKCPYFRIIVRLIQPILT